MSRGHEADAYLFDHQVMGVLSRAGCNSGPCHGNLNGKGGFALSLRGQDPWFDYLAITHDLAGRRVNRAAPRESLLLLKPTAAVPHQGGQRILPGSEEYRILQRWVAGGTAPPAESAPSVVQLSIEPSGLVVATPEQRFQIRSRATFSDGTQQDVSHLVSYEASNFVARVAADGGVEAASVGEVTVSVRYLNQQVSARFAFVPQGTQSPDGALTTLAQNPIDTFVHSKLQRLGRSPQPTAPDHLILRRVYLDVLGRLPTADMARDYVADKRADKAIRLIDRVLADPRAADRWALIWSDLLRNEEKLLDSTGVDRFHRWIRQAFADSIPLNRFTSQLITSRGSTYEQPATNFYRALRDPLTRGEAAARVFLGIRLQCAKCHNHPFDRWTQDDYYSWASLFARIDYEILENNRKDRLDKSEFVGEQRVVIKDEGEVTNVRTGRPASPDFLQAARQASVRDDGDRLQQLAAWLGSPNNRQFARAQVNRIWYHLMGRGLVDPIDDFRVTNPASHPDLLEWLAAEFIRSDFDVRHVMRLILTSSSYQASAVADDSDELAVNNYAGAQPRRLTAEQLLDSQCAVLETPAHFNGYPVGIQANQLAGVERVRRRDRRPSEDDRFLTLFGKPSRQMSCECERSSDTTLAQAFYLINGQGLQSRLNADDNWLAQWSRSQRSNEAIVDQLFWQTLSRSPTLAERETAVKHLASATNRLEGLRDLGWALLNAKEFLYRY